MPDNVALLITPVPLPDLEEPFTIHIPSICDTASFEQFRTELAKLLAKLSPPDPFSYEISPIEDNRYFEVRILPQHLGMPTVTFYKIATGPRQNREKNVRAIIEKVLQIRHYREDFSEITITISPKPNLPPAFT